MTTGPLIARFVPGYLLGTPLGTWMDFGKHKGTNLTEVPEDYLRWALHEITDAPDEFRQIIRDELHRRKHEGVGSFDFEGDG